MELQEPMEDHALEETSAEGGHHLHNVCSTGIPLLPQATALYEAKEGCEHIWILSFKSSLFAEKMTVV